MDKVRSGFRYNKFFRGLGLIAGLLLIQACSAPLNEEEACNFVRNSQARRVSWGQDTPVEIFLDSSVPTNYYEAIENAARRWNDLKGRELLVIRRASNPGSATPRRDGVNKVYFIEDWEANRPATEQARTTIYWSGPRIFEADVRINAENFRFFLRADEANYSEVHLESLLIHEFGHVLGLAHNESEESVMQTALGFGQVRADLDKADLASLSCEY